MLSDGIPVTLNTDDPAVSGITLAHEYDVAAPAAGLSREQLHEIQRNGLAVTFLDESCQISAQSKALTPADVGFIKGLELSNLLYEEAVKPILRSTSPISTTPLPL
jgi:hypothetical protein